jgi:hypothetical protein
MEWVSESTVTYCNFQINEPNNARGLQDHILMWARPVGAHIEGWVPGKWNDFTSTASLKSSYTLRSGGTRTAHSLVKVSQTVPEPTTTALLALGPV